MKKSSGYKSAESACHMKRQPCPNDHAGKKNTVQVFSRIHDETGWKSVMNKPHPSINVYQHILQQFWQ
jgi:hypothetical protein